MSHETVTQKFTKGDLLRVPKAKLKNRDGTPVDLTGMTVKFRMVNQTGAVVEVNDASATVVNALTGEVKYQWVVGDIDTAGSYWAWFIRVEGGQTEHFPAGHLYEIIIYDVV